MTEHLQQRLWTFIWKNRRCRSYLLTGIGLLLVEWWLFNLLYPYPNFVLDSYFYIDPAFRNLTFNVWPIGYSKFIQAFALFTHSAGLFTWTQYLVMGLSYLVFFFSWIYIFHPGKIIRLLFFLFFFANPIFLFCANFILADSLFVSLSILWFTQLLWILYRPRRWMLLTHALWLVAAFTVRYNAMYYPIISIVVFLFSRQRPWVKIAGCLLPLVLVGSFVLYTSAQIGQNCGKKQFSPFGGWKLATNALYMYQFVKPATADTAPLEFRALDAQVRRSLTRMPFPIDLQYPEFSHGSYFMFAPESPLLIYAARTYPDGAELNSRGWNAIAPLYQSYGKYLVLKYPGAFFQYFIWPNIQRYAIPPNVIFGAEGSFNLNPYFQNQVHQLLGFRSIQTPSNLVRLFMNFQAAYPIVIAFIHFLFLLGLAAMLLGKGFSTMPTTIRYCVGLAILVWLFDAGFNILTAAVQLRYEIFSEILEMAFGLYCIEYAYRRLEQKEKGKGLLVNLSPDHP